MYRILLSVILVAILSALVIVTEGIKAPSLSTDHPATSEAKPTESTPATAGAANNANDPFSKLSVN